MGRRSVVAGDEFLPGMTLDELRRLMKEEKDPRNVPRYLMVGHNVFHDFAGVLHCLTD